MLQQVDASVVEIHTREQITRGAIPHIVDVSAIASGVMMSADWC